MHFDIVEAIRQKQRQQAPSISTDNSDTVDITNDDGTVIVRILPQATEDRRP